MSLILAIETSCDETAAAVVEAGQTVHSSVVSSQIDLHARYGGVVPEVASRAHVGVLMPVVAQAMIEAAAEPADLAGVAATAGPGLIGSLLVGVSAAKTLALVWDRPFVAVNHLEGHLYAPLLEEPALRFPLVTLLVSGGHTMIVLVRGRGDYEVIGETVDDAAGEAFDKVARFLGLGYPGGPVVDRLAREGDPNAIVFPRPMLDKGYDFSFSGLKTAVINHVRQATDVDVADVCASFQEAVVDTLVTKTVRAGHQTGATALCLGGGVAANSRLRSRLLEAAEADGFGAFAPTMAYCTDNAAMIGAAGWWRLQSDGPSPLDAGADSNWRLTAL